MKSIFNWLCALMLAAWLPFAAAADFLPPEQAFVLKAELRDAHTVTLRWAIPPGYHLYRERLSFTGPGVGQPQLPGEEQVR